MDGFNSLLLMLDGLLGSSPWFPFALLGVGAFFTLYLRLPQLTYFRHAWRILAGKYAKADDPGDTSHFQALSTALSGTVGTGNIGGVGLAIFIGGPAALFWMWMTAFLGMATKLAEVTLSHNYRVKTADGSMAGGPMYYMERGLKLRWLAIFFAIATVVSSFGTGNLPQVNNIAASVQTSFGVPPILTGAVLAVVLAFVIVGGIQRIARVSSALVPSMALLYFVGAMGVILWNWQNVLPSFLSVFSNAFTGSAAAGGFLGATFAYAFTRGVNRGLFSNEAGQGSAPIAHACAKTKQPAAEGMVSLLEPFIDTIIICTLTGLVILSSGVWTQKHQNSFQTADLQIVAGSWRDDDAAQREALFNFLSQRGDQTVLPFSGSIEVTQGLAVNSADFTVLNARSVAEDLRFSRNGQPFDGLVEVRNGKPLNSEVTLEGRSLLHSSALTTVAFSAGLFGAYGQYIVSLSLALFAFSTAIAWSYYGDRAIIYLVGQRGVLPYRVLYCLGFFLASFTDTTLIWNFAAVSVVLMTLPNLLGLMLMRRQVKGLVNEYWGGVEAEQEALSAVRRNAATGESPAGAADALGK